MARTKVRYNRRMWKPADASPIDPADVSALYAAAGDRLPDMIEELVSLVQIESPSGHGQGLEAMADALTRLWQPLGATVHRHRSGAGPHLEVLWPGPPGTQMDAQPALLVGHVDTVHPLGALHRNPVRRDDDGRLHGPGTQDMKSGLVVTRHAALLLADRGASLPRPVTLLLTADEETGSTTSRDLIEDRARDSAYALVFEGSAPGGVIKTARKGVGMFDVEVRGRAAHAGAHFDEGVNAAVGLAEVLPQIAALTDLAHGTTVNIGLVRAGTAINVVPERGVASVDLRFRESAEADRVEAALRGLRTTTGELHVRGGVNRPVMPRTAGTAALFSAARDLVAHEQQLEETAVGGASDGNFTAAVGIPTLDGLGPDGAGLHTDSEWVDAPSMARRAALAAALLASL